MVGKRALLLSILLPTLLPAAVIRGTVVEHQTGKALARALVDLQPVPGTPGKPLTIRTNSYGRFEFLSVPPGAYLLKASKRGFITAEHGQKRWNSSGLPFTVTEEQSQFITFRLPRYGAIIGSVLDENDVGLPEHEVVAYRSSQPPKLAGHATSDERGGYRLSGLEPGVYLVRTAGKLDDGTEFIPTFSKETLRVEDAHTVQVYVDEDTKNEDVRPAIGKLFTLIGAAEPPNGGPVNVILSSDLGRRRVTGPQFRFNALPPGRYELRAETPQGARFQSAYMEFTINSDPAPLNLALQPGRETRVEFIPPLPDGTNAPQMTARRKDFAGVEEPEPLQLVNGRTQLGLGRWEILLTPPAGYYVSAFLGMSRGTTTRNRPDGWNEILVSNNSSTMRFSLSTGPGSLHGIVKASGDPAVGAPVFLEGYDAATRQRVTDLKVARTDTYGAYRFDGLAPGTYRVLSTFEYLMPDADTMELAKARHVEIAGSKDSPVDLDLYVIQ